MSKQEDFRRPEKLLEETREIDDEARISKKAEMKRKFNRNQKRVTLWDNQLSSLTSLDDSKRIFNYRLSRFRRCSKNAFRIIAARFRIVNSPINLVPEKVTKLLLAIAVPHCFSLTKSRGSYLPSGFVEEENLETGEVISGEWRQNI